MDNLKHLSNDLRRKNSACERNRDLILHLYAVEGRSACSIAKLVKTSTRHVTAFLRRNGIGVGEVLKKRMPSKEDHYNWKGGRVVNKSGYIEVYAKGHPNARKHTPYILEHRLVMEQMIGRYLLPKEVVHHRDGNVQNNSPENLQLFSENSEHLAHELRGKCPKWTPEGRKKLETMRWTHEEMKKMRDCNTLPHFRRLAQKASSSQKG